MYHYVIGGGLPLIGCTPVQFIPPENRNIQHKIVMELLGVSSTRPPTPPFPPHLYVQMALPKSATASRSFRPCTRSRSEVSLNETGHNSSSSREGQKGGRSEGGAGQEGIRRGNILQHVRILIRMNHLFIWYCRPDFVKHE